MRRVVTLALVAVGAIATADAQALTVARQTPSISVIDQRVDDLHRRRHARPRPQRPVRPHRPERPERPERRERPERLVRPERPERIARPDRPERPVRPERPARPAL
jgi:hypothetical protein